MATPAATLRQQAIVWLVEARSGTMDTRQHRALEDWRGADPAHEAAWAEVSCALSQALQPLAPHTGTAAAAQAAMGALLQPPPRRRQALRGALALAGLGCAGLAAHRITPLPGLLADAHTATAERRPVALADGSHLLLDARSAVDVSMDADSRRVHLRRGALIATVAADAAGRPFTVHTPYGEVSVQARAAAGARCMVRLQDAGAQVAALAQPLVLRPPHRPDAALLPGRTAWMQAGGRVADSSASADDLAAWQQGMLAVRNGTLDEVVQALRPYRRGFIRLSPTAAALRVLGAFPLDDTDHTLQALADTLPITVARHQGGWLVVIDHA